MHVKIIRTDGTEDARETEPSGLFALLERELGGSPFEYVTLDMTGKEIHEREVMAVRDDGYEVAPVTLPNGTVRLEAVRALLPDNAKATELYHAVCIPGTTHRIVGDVAIFRDYDLSDA